MSRKPSPALTSSRFLLRSAAHHRRLHFAVALGVAWNSAVTVGFGLLYVVPFWMHTMIEEQMFAKHFGDAYAEYRKRVPRLVPGMDPKV